MRGFFIRCMAGKRVGEWWWCWTLNMFLKELRSGRQSGNTMDGGLNKRKLGTGIYGNKFATCEKTRVCG